MGELSIPFDFFPPSFPPSLSAANSGAPFICDFFFSKGKMSSQVSENFSTKKKKIFSSCHFESLMQSNL